MKEYDNFEEVMEDEVTSITSEQWENIKSTDSRLNYGKQEEQLTKTIKLKKQNMFNQGKATQVLKNWNVTEQFNKVLWINNHRN